MDEGTLDDKTSDVDAKVQVLQAVVDRVISWQESADEATVRAELDEAVAGSGIEVEEEVRERIVAHVASDHAPHVDVRQFLS